MAKYYILLVMLLALVSCAKDLKTEPIKIETRVGLSDYEVIEALGLSVEGIVDCGDYYLVEEDIIIEKDSIWLYLPDRRTRQERAPALITNGRENGIRIKISSNNLPDNDWRNAAKEAANIWGGVPDCNVLSYNSKVSVMVHELGHILGLYHTNTTQNSGATTYLATGTPDWDKGQYDGFSIMNQGSLRRPWREPNPYTGGVYGFTSGDILAIQRLYGTPTYITDITGPNTLAPGQTATYSFAYGPYAQDYAAWFEPTVWTTDETIVSQTNNSVTIRCDHGAPHRITLTAAATYNGYTARKSIVINKVFTSIIGKFRCTDFPFQMYENLFFSRLFNR